MAKTFDPPKTFPGAGRDLNEDDPDDSWETITERKSRKNVNSAAAAKSISPAARASIRERVLAFIAAHPEGVIYEEIIKGLEMYPPTASSALSILKKHGLVRIEGNRRTSRGRMAAVHFISGSPGDEEARKEGGKGELETEDVKGAAPKRREE